MLFQSTIVWVTGTIGGTIKGPAFKRTRSLFISQVMGDATEKDMNDFLLACDIIGAEVLQKSHKDSKYKSYKVTVPLDMYDKVRNPDIWDVGILIRDFKELRRPYF